MISRHLLSCKKHHQCPEVFCLKRFREDKTGDLGKIRRQNRSLFKWTIMSTLNYYCMLLEKCHPSRTNLLYIPRDSFYYISGRENVMKTRFSNSIKRHTWPTSATGRLRCPPFIHLPFIPQPSVQRSKQKEVYLVAWTSLFLRCSQDGKSWWGSW